MANFNKILEYFELALLLHILGDVDHAFNESGAASKGIH